MRVAVTGAAGHLGANLVRALLGAGQEVRALVHERSASLDGLAIERRVGDVRDPETLRAFCTGAEIVYHLAARLSVAGGARPLEQVNVAGTQCVAEAALAAGVRRLVHVSSIHALAKVPGRPVDEGAPLAVGPEHGAYARSKAAGEARIRRAIARGLDAVIVNPTGVLGRHDHRPSRLGRFFLALYRRHVPALVAGGFDWVDVRDVVASLLAAAERGPAGENYILSGHAASMGELAALAAAVTGVPSPRLEVPLWMAGLGAPVLAAAARALRREPLVSPEAVRALRPAPAMVHDKAAAALGHAPRPLHSTVEDVYRSFRELGAIPPTAPLALGSEATLTG